MTTHPDVAAVGESSVAPFGLADVLSADEQWTVLWALADRFVSIRQRRDRALEFHADGRRPVSGGSFADIAARDTERLAKVEAVAAKLPAYLRDEWSREINRRAV